MSVLGACRLCAAPMSTHVVGGLWIGCPAPRVWMGYRPSSLTFLPSADLLAIDLTIAALERQRPQAEPVGEIPSEDRAAAAYARQRLGPSEVHQSIPRAHCEG